MANRAIIPVKKGPTKVNKICMYCGGIHEQVMSASVNCTFCKKRGLRTMYGEVDGKPYTVED